MFQKVYQLFKEMLIKILGLYPDKSFDYVILSQTIQATIEPEKILTELTRIGKKVIVSIPNFGFWKVRLDLLLKGKCQ